MRQTSMSGGMGDAQSGRFRVEDAGEMMVAGLRNAHGLERQAIGMLECNTERLETCPQLEARLAQHAEVSRHIALMATGEQKR